MHDILEQLASKREAARQGLVDHVPQEAAQAWRADEAGAGQDPGKLRAHGRDRCAGRACLWSFYAQHRSPAGRPIAGGGGCCRAPPGGARKSGYAPFRRA